MALQHESRIKNPNQITSVASGSAPQQILKISIKLDEIYEKNIVVTLL